MGKCGKNGEIWLIWNNILASLLCSFKEDFKLTYEYKQGMVAQPDLGNQKNYK